MPPLLIFCIACSVVNISQVVITVHHRGYGRLLLFGTANAAESGGFFMGSV